ncbi:hypothetical protein QR680_010126 [Steinernema hermaphroditum]|uniref:Uncharacterized protein n=1 Tax=Steinernema hermaphroditum TaxID=289476 RepID=A0AA39MAZ7_9BILA|nr:hypothetical protein QR680_010126 [Steinernema hermaphroditum]
MDKFIFKPDEYQKYYNCSHMSLSEWGKFEEKRPILGLLCILVGTVNMMAYVPCLFVISRRIFFKYSCFKIMFFLGLLDSVCIFFNSFLTGYLHIVGTVFCCTPNVQYISGCILNACWFGECFGCALLAFNRCIDFILPNVSKFLFFQWKTYVWVVFMFLYALVAFSFEVPVVLNSAAIMWTFNAFIIFPKDLVPVNHQDYISTMNDYNNRILLSSMVISYMVLIVAIAVRGKGTNQTKTQAQVFTVAILICGLNFVPGFVFFLLETIPVTNILLYLCLFTWQMGNGGGGLILIVFNRSIRSEVIHLFKKATITPSSNNVVSSTSGPRIYRTRKTTMNNYVKN